MVYRGKPSAGCEQCRNAKKSCTLERPACSRCVKLKKVCEGYRDVDAMKFRNESQAIIRKARKAAQRHEASKESDLENSSSGLATLISPSDTKESTTCLQHTSRDGSVGMALSDTHKAGTLSLIETSPELISMSYVLPLGIIPRGNDIAKGYFFKQFTSDRHWNFLENESELNKDSCLDLAIRACGMAALDNIRPIPNGRTWSRQIYANALSKLNAALCDPVAVKRDQSLIAVAVLSYYENLTCDSWQSVQSWKAHINGAAEILRLRGRSQLNTEIGRTLFREFRSQILTYCIWDDIEPAAFLRDWGEDLATKTPYQGFVEPGDTLTDYCMDFAHIRAQLRLGTISTINAIAAASRIENDMIRWGVETPQVAKMWRFQETRLPDSPHFWNGTVHTFENQNAPTSSTWNFWRSMRILLSRTQESLAQRVHLPPAERERQQMHIRTVRRQMADDICATVPVALGHANKAIAQCTLITAYGSIWPLFFAGTCALERVEEKWWMVGAEHVAAHKRYAASAAAAQAAWVIGRMEYISREIGLRWAEGVAAVLKGDFSIHWDLLPEGEVDVDGNAGV